MSKGLRHSYSSHWTLSLPQPSSALEPLPCTLKQYQARGDFPGPKEKPSLWRSDSR